MPALHVLLLLLCFLCCLWGHAGCSSRTSCKHIGVPQSFRELRVPLITCRYEREFNRGHRPLLRAVFQHDEVASAAMVLMVASVHLPPGAPRGSREDSGTAAAATVRAALAWLCLLTFGLPACVPAVACRCCATVRWASFLSRPPDRYGLSLVIYLLCLVSAAGADRWVVLDSCLMRQTPHPACSQRPYQPGWEPHTTAACFVLPACAALQPAANGMHRCDSTLDVWAECIGLSCHIRGDSSAAPSPAAGDKLRICGGELTSPGPGDPLEAASTGEHRQQSGQEEFPLVQAKVHRPGLHGKQRPYHTLRAVVRLLHA